MLSSAGAPRPSKRESADPSSSPFLSLFAHRPGVCPSRTHSARRPTPCATTRHRAPNVSGRNRVPQRRRSAHAGRPPGRPVPQPRAAVRDLRLGCRTTAAHGRTAARPPRGERRVCRRGRHVRRGGRQGRRLPRGAVLERRRGRHDAVCGRHRRCGSGARAVFYHAARAGAASGGRLRVRRPGDRRDAPRHLRRSHGRGPRGGTSSSPLLFPRLPSSPLLSPRLPWLLPRRPWYVVVAAAAAANRPPNPPPTPR